MRVRKICPECQKLKMLLDFNIDESTVDKKTEYCSLCLQENENLTNNNPLKLKDMATLKEKREAELAAKQAAVVVGTTPTPKAVKTTPKATSTPKTTPVEAPVEEKGEPVEVKEEEGTPVEEEKKPKPTAEPKVTTPKVEKEIEQLDITGEKVIATHKTLKEAADSVEATTAYLMDGLKGWSKSVKGFKWRYKGEEIVVREKKVVVPAEPVEAPAEKEPKKGK